MRLVSQEVRKTNPILLGLLSGALLSAAYRLPGFWPLSFIALIPLLEVVFRGSRPNLSPESHPIRDAFFAGTVAGFCIMGTGTSWFFSAIPLPAGFGVSTLFVQVAFVGISWTLVCLVTGAMVGVWAMSIRLLKIEAVFDSLTIAVLWTVGEFARMYSFNLLTFDTVVHNPAFFSAGFIAYPLMDSENWRQLLVFGGIAFLSFVIAAVNVFLYKSLILKNRKHQLVWIICIVVLLAAVSFLPIVSMREYFSPTPTSQGLVRVAVVSLDTPERAGDINLSSYDKKNAAIVTSAVAAHADVVLLPEDTRFIATYDPKALAGMIGASSTAVVIDSSPVQLPDGTRPIGSFLENTSNIIPVRSKIVFTPQGEYIPYLFRLFLHAVGAVKAEESFDSVRDFTQGNDGTPASFDGIHASVLFCLEVMLPNLGKTLAAEQGSSLLLVPSSDAVFQSSPALNMDTLRWNQAQAVSAGLPLAQSADLAPGFVLDKYGRIIAEVGKNGAAGFIIAPLQL